MKNTFIVFNICIILLTFYGCDKQQSTTETIINLTRPIPKTYSEFLETDINPGIDPTYSFPVSYQYQNGCFAFAVKHIVDYKYDINIDPYEAEELINKPRADLWTREHIVNFLEKYNLKFEWFGDTETFFSFLQKGEPVLIQYKYQISEDKWIGHFVAAYSFDSEGVWIADSISGKRIRIPFTDVFDTNESQTQFRFATIKTPKHP